jgi:SAM-dependent methyltransferase
MSREARRINEAQFTKTASRFAENRALERRGPFEELLRLTAPDAGDRVLDVACGAGTLLGMFAPRVRRGVGVDLTTAMLLQGRARGLEHRGVLLVRGAAEQLPFSDGTFSIVVTTWAVHHFADPLAIVREMVRVCRPGGRVAIGDSVGDEDDAKRARQNAIERLRDPAHVEVLSPSGLIRLLVVMGLTPIGAAHGELLREFDEWCRVSAAPPEAAARARAMLVETIPGDLAGLAPLLEGGRLRFRHRWTMVAAQKA